MRFRCGICREVGHTARTCRQRPDATMHCPLPADAVMQVWYDRLRPIWRAASYDLNPIRSAMVSAYVQGALDTRRPEVAEAMRALATPPE
jgi:hypothetical protein